MLDVTYTNAQNFIFWTSCVRTTPHSIHKRNVCISTLKPLNQSSRFKPLQPVLRLNKSAAVFTFTKSSLKRQFYILRYWPSSFRIENNILNIQNQTCQCIYYAGISYLWSRSSVKSTDNKHNKLIHKILG
jgi:hypothetical protein